MPGDTTFLVGEQVDRLEFEELERQGSERERRRPAQALPVLQGITKASPANSVVHLGRVLPGDHAGAYGGGRVRQDRQSVGPEGERHRRPAHPGGHRQRDEPAAADRRGSRQGGGRGGRRGGRRRPLPATSGPALGRRLTKQKFLPPSRRSPSPPTLFHRERAAEAWVRRTPGVGKIFSLSPFGTPRGHAKSSLPLGESPVKISQAAGRVGGLGLGK